MIILKFLNPIIPANIYLVCTHGIPDLRADVADAVLWNSSISFLSVLLMWYGDAIKVFLRFSLHIQYMPTSISTKIPLKSSSL
jgi:hypothetical protein